MDDTCGLHAVDSKTARAQYTETEAAQALGISVEELRRLVRTYIGASAEADEQITVFQPSDVVVLRFFASQREKMGA